MRPRDFPGTGYFTIPLLATAQVAFLHACELNPNSVKLVSDASTLYPLENSQSSKLHLSARVVKITNHYTIRPFERSSGTQAVRSRFWRPCTLRPSTPASSTPTRYGESVRHRSTTVLSGVCTLTSVPRLRAQPQLGRAVF